MNVVYKSTLGAKPGTDNENTYIYLKCKYTNENA